MHLAKWLYPGMRVKRWLALLFIGILVISSGVALLVDIEFVGSIETLIKNTAFQLTGNRPGTASAVAGIVLVALGVFLVSLGVRLTIRSLIDVVIPGETDRLADIVYARRQLRRGPRIVVLGGGTGLSTLLRGLKTYSSNLTAIVTVADDGGSSGRLRNEMGIPPPGDIRNTLVSLADTEPLMEKLFQYRFRSGHGLEGHSFGNLFIAAMTDVLGDFELAIRESSKVLAVRGRVLPSTVAEVVLKARFADGSSAAGESAIPKIGKPIDRVFLDPADPVPVEEGLEALRAADAIILGPGSLYTSVLPNLLVPGIRDAVRRSHAMRIYVCNIMTQPGETDHYGASDHVRAILDHVGPGILDYVVVNDQSIPENQLERYRAEGARPVTPDPDIIEEMGLLPVARPLVSLSEVVRHDPDKLGQVLISLVAEGSGFLWKGAGGRNDFRPGHTRQKTGKRRADHE